MPRLRGRNGRWVRSIATNTDSTPPTTVSQSTTADVLSSQLATPAIIGSVDHSESNIKATRHEKRDGPGFDHQVTNASPATSTAILVNKNSIDSSDEHNHQPYPRNLNSVSAVLAQSLDIRLIGDIILCLFAVAFISCVILPACKEMWDILFAWLNYMFRGCWLLMCNAPTGATRTSSWNPLCGQSNLKGEGIVNSCVLGGPNRYG